MKSELKKNSVKQQDDNNQEIIVLCKHCQFAYQENAVPSSCGRCNNKLNTNNVETKPKKEMGNLIIEFQKKRRPYQQLSPALIEKAISLSIYKPGSYRAIH